MISLVIKPHFCLCTYLFKDRKFQQQQKPKNTIWNWINNNLGILRINRFVNPLCKYYINISLIMKWKNIYLRSPVYK